MPSDTASDDGGSDGVATDASGETGSASGSGATGESGGVVLASPFGYDVVVEEEFVEFPWLAGMRRAPVALLVSFAVVFLLAAIGGVGQQSLLRTAVYLVLVLYGLHNIPSVQGRVPEILRPVAEQIGSVPYLRGFVLSGLGHGNPVRHVVDITSGKTESIGHVNVLPSDPTVPIEVYAAVPMLVLVATGFEFALRYWDEVTVDSVVEVGRFGAAVGAGYVLVLFLGSFVFTINSGLFGILLPDRYMTVIFGFVYPAVFVTVGALLVHLQQEVLPADGDATGAGSGE
ncbi:MAG: hypothetical protein ABEJ40_08605 [Haloarculaceae archaeon]